MVAGVAYPAGASGGAPAFGSDDVQAEEVCQDAGGQVLGEVEQSTAAAGPWIDAESSEPVAKRCGMGGATRPSSEKQPRVVSCKAPCRARADEHWEALQEGGEWLADLDGVGSQAQVHAPAAGVGGDVEVCSS